MSRSETRCGAFHKSLHSDIPRLLKQLCEGMSRLRMYVPHMKFGGYRVTDRRLKLQEDVKLEVKGGKLEVKN